MIISLEPEKDTTINFLNIKKNSIVISTIETKITIEEYDISKYLDIITNIFNNYFIHKLDLLIEDENYLKKINSTTNTININSICVYYDYYEDFHAHFLEILVFLKKISDLKSLDLVFICSLSSEHAEAMSLYINSNKNIVELSLQDPHAYSISLTDDDLIKIFSNTSLKKITIDVSECYYFCEFITKFIIHNKTLINITINYYDNYYLEYGNYPNEKVYKCLKFNYSIESIIFGDVKIPDFINDIFQRNKKLPKINFMLENNFDINII